MVPLLVCVNGLSCWSLNDKSAKHDVVGADEQMTVVASLAEMRVAEVEAAAAVWMAVVALVVDVWNLRLWWWWWLRLRWWWW